MEEHRKKQMSDAADAFNACQESFLENVILLPPECCNQMKRLLDTAKKAYTDFTMYEGFPKERMDDESYQDMIRRRTEAHKAMDGEFASVKDKLQELFRELLGVDSANSHP
jgi:hypothetical protein